MLRIDASGTTIRRIGLAAGLALGFGALGSQADAARAPTFWIAGVGGAIPAETVTVYFNPKEFTVDKSVPWKRHRAEQGDSQTMEFTAGEPYRVEMVLLFETYDSKTSVLEVTGALEKLAVEDPNDPTGRPDVAVSWDGRQWITKLLDAHTKVTDRTPEGAPLAATVLTLWSKFVEVVDPPPVVDPMPVVISSPRGKVACDLEASSVRLLTQHPSGIVTSHAVSIDLERGLPPGVAFAEGEPKRLHMDFLLDTLEQKTDVRVLIDLLRTIIAEPREGGDGEEEERPTRVKVTWPGDLPAFEGVIASVGTKYTMFLPNGTPVRATCSVRFKEASRLSFRRGESGNGDDDVDDGGDDDGEEEVPTDSDAS